VPSHPEKGLGKHEELLDEETYPRMIRVLHFASIINRHDFIDGCLAALDRRRFDVRAVTLVAPRHTAPYGDGERYPTECFNLSLARRDYPRIVWKLLQAIHDFRPHILHAHHFDEAFLAALALPLAGKPAFVVGRHWTEHVYVQTQGLKRAAVLLVESFFNSRADRVVVPIQSDAELIIRRQQVPRRKVAVIPYGFDFRRCVVSSPEAPARLRREFGFERAYLALACCRLNPEKGLDSLLNALPPIVKEHPEFRLVFVGDGPSRQELEEQMRRLHLEAYVTFAGWRNDAMDWMATADVVVQPSRSESFCQVLVEALGFRKPVIMTPVGAGPDIIGANEHGTLVPIGDSAALTAALRETLADPQRALEKAERGRALVRDQYTPQRAARLHESLYLDILDRPQRHRLRPIALAGATRGG
jgi:glycosyltransferase involved in cell wall biosynthesis